MANCSNDFPSTSVFYSEIGDDITSIVLLALGCLMTVVCIGLFVEELVFLQKVEYGNETKMKKVATILGLFPVTMLMALISILVPPSTILVDLIASCYLSVCFYTFVTLTIDYFGGEDKMIDVLADEKIRTNTPPCCCCCCCILRPITLTRKSLLIFKLCSLQVAVVRPLLLFIAAVLWTDGRYSRNFGGGATSYTFISIITAISTMFSMYGTVVIFRASRTHLKHYSLGIKFSAFQLLLILSNIQNAVFSILGTYGIPECIGSRGPQMRANNLNHSVLVIESFLLCLLARRGYRRDESALEPPQRNSKLIQCENGQTETNDTVNVANDDVTLENGARDNEQEQYGGLSYDNQGLDLDDMKHSTT